MVNDGQLLVVAVILVFFGGVCLWLRREVHAFDRKYGSTGQSDHAEAMALGREVILRRRKVLSALSKR